MSTSYSSRGRRQAMHNISPIGSSRPARLVLRTLIILGSSWVVVARQGQPDSTQAREFGRCRKLCLDMLVLHSLVLRG